jgi:zona occludens toxin
MITYLEGLPRSGKSLNCIKDYVVPALAKGRAVDAYVAGLNHEKIAELANITLEECQKLLVALEVEQLKEVWKYVRNDSLVVLDEAEEHWPASRKPSEEPLRHFVHQHGHRGLDIVLMGQTFNELHTTFKSRTAQKNVYLKREAAGKPNEFSVTIQKPVRKGDKIVWQEVQHIKGQPYDTNYFGAYKSHTDDTTNKETFIDERANVWNNPVLKKWLPVYGGVFIVACYLVYDAFAGDTLTKNALDQEAKNKAQSTPAQVVNPAPQPVQNPLPTATPQPAQKTATNSFTGGSNVQPKTPLFIDENVIPDPPPDLIDHLSQKGRIRLTGFIRKGNQSEGWIEWRSDSFAVLERMSFSTLKTLGWNVLVNQEMDMAILQNYHKRYIATVWPLPDPQGKITENKNEEIKVAQGNEIP